MTGVTPLANTDRYEVTMKSLTAGEVGTAVWRLHEAHGLRFVRAIVVKENG